jgi:hypothetical protein
VVWPDPKPQDWPRDHRCVLVRRLGPPDHAGRCFYEELWWAGRYRRRSCAFDWPPWGPGVIDLGDLGAEVNSNSPRLPPARTARPAPPGRDPSRLDRLRRRAAKRR